MAPTLSAARQTLDRCQILARYTEEPGFITRTFLSGPMHGVHAQVRAWMEDAGMSVAVDAVGNIRGIYPGLVREDSSLLVPRLIIGSHLDTVPRAGAYDGILGVVMGVSLAELLAGRRLNFAIEVIGFSEEEGVRFGKPFLGSLALTGDLGADLLKCCDAGGITVAEVIQAYGLDPSLLGEAHLAEGTFAYLEFHIEQGPVLESLHLPLGVVTAIAGQSRLEVVFEGAANHAGTTPMHLRRDALAAAAEWIGEVERMAIRTPDLVATVGKIQADPGAGNVIPGLARLSLDIRHCRDDLRREATAELLQRAAVIAARRQVNASSCRLLDQEAVAMDVALVEALSEAVASTGQVVHRLHSGAGHDAMILARRVPAAMLFLRSPGGTSHHPDERVLLEDVAAALAVGLRFLEKRDCERA